VLGSGCHNSGCFSSATCTAAGFVWSAHHYFDCIAGSEFSKFCIFVIANSFSVFYFVLLIQVVISELFPSTLLVDVSLALYPGNADPLLTLWWPLLSLTRITVRNLLSFKYIFFTSQHIFSQSIRLWRWCYSCTSVSVHWLIWVWHCGFHRPTGLALPLVSSSWLIQSHFPCVWVSCNTKRWSFFLFDW
jgi:hypothetical protein